jgi:hypothetical protein
MGVIALINNEQEVLYRYRQSGGRVYVLTFKVIGHTKRCVWIDYMGERKLVSMYSRKRFAYPSKREALENFIARTKRHIMLTEGNLNLARQSLSDAENKLGGIDESATG